MCNVFDHPWFKYGEGKKITRGESYNYRCPLNVNPPEWDGFCGLIGCPDKRSCSNSQYFLQAERSGLKHKGIRHGV